MVDKMMKKKKRATEKGSSQPKRLASGKKGKKEKENPVTQAKMFCTEAASHEKGGNFKRALHCYNLVKKWTKLQVQNRERTRENKMNDVEDTAVDSTNGDEESENAGNLTGGDECEDKDDGTKAEKKREVGAGKKSKKKGRKGKQTGEKGKNGGGKKKVEVKPPSPRISAKSAFAQIAKELKAKRIAQMQYAAAMAKKRKKNRVLRDEEIYTDKDRAAAVNLGTRDIKQSLKMKKKQDKVPGSQIPEEAEPGTLLAMGNNELRNGDLKNALTFMNKALELNPDDKNGLVARSKCYLSLGDPQLALQDAETALQSDKTFVRAIFQKAEALYHLGDFEHSLMYYHRGHRLRPELECFRLGVQKAQEAIENTIGSTAGLRNRRTGNKVPSSASSSIKTGESNRNEKSSTENESGECWSSLASDKLRRRTRSKSAVPVMKTSTRRFLGELGADRLYLENLLNHPDLNCSNEEAANIIRAQAEEGISFLKSRQEFWRQQRPNSSARKGKKNE